VAASRPRCRGTASGQARRMLALTRFCRRLPGFRSPTPDPHQGRVGPRPPRSRPFRQSRAVALTTSGGPLGPSDFPYAGLPDPSPAAPGCSSPRAEPAQSPTPTPIGAIQCLTFVRTSRPETSRPFLQSASNPSTMANLSAFPLRDPERCAGRSRGRRRGRTP
jgi:hypothetical protein